MAKLRFFFKLLIIFFILFNSIESFGQKYSIDDQKNMKTTKIRTRKTKTDRSIEKKLRKEDQKKKKRIKKGKNFIKKYNKNVSGGGKEINKKDKVYRRMRRSQREAKKNREK